MKYSFTNGINWENNEYIVCDKSMSRNGMPSVSQLIDGSLIITMEGFWSNSSNCGWNHFNIGYLRSFNNGKTWNDNKIIYAPCIINSNYNAGAPWIISNNEKIFVSFMSNYNPNSKIKQNQTWPNGAWIQIIEAIITINDNYNTSLILFNYSNIETVTPIDSFWAAMFIINDRNQSSSELFVEYQRNDSTYVKKHVQ